MATNFANDSNHNNSKAKSVNGLTDSAGVPTVSGSDTYSTITYAASVALNFALENVQSLSLTGNVTFTTSNRAVTKGKVLRIICDATTRTLTFPSGWVWLGASAPTSIAASKTGILSLYCFGANDTDVIASYAVQS